MTGPDERRWTSQIRSGDKQAFELLYEHYAERVAGFVMRLVGSRSECDDIVQEVFIAAYVGRQSFNGRSKPLAWLLGIAIRRCRDLRRKRAIPLTEDGEIDDIGSLERSRERPVEDQTVNTLTLTRALEHLQPEFREALLLVGSQGLTYKEASEVTGEPIGTVKWRVSVASKQMRLRLNESEEEVNELPKITT